ncbi:MAG TPA: YhjD/YihY/BrkB family envelope integrity protein [Patescibacteria group bacterium]|nr:YhjD/YihY/BrkB family envelope integrity protein [Patescibacteria group bacterium]
MAARTSLFAAAIAFQALLALAPILLVLTSLAGRMLGQEAARRSLMEAAVRFAGPGADQVVSNFLDMITDARGYAAGTILGIVLLLFFGSSFFAQLRGALDSIWEVKPRGLGRALFGRVLSFIETIVAVSAAILVLGAGALRSIAGPLLARTGTLGVFAWSAWTRIGTLAMTCALLGAAFRYIPDVRPRPTWASILAGALPAAVALGVAGDLFGFVIGKSAVASLYGAAGSVIMFLLWVQYSAWILLFGAELCRAWDETGP